eukprot:COSAG05_NODE_465_length_9537_cov_21.527086_7_plen_86_part_00
MLPFSWLLIVVSALGLCVAASLLYLICTHAPHELTSWRPLVSPMRRKPVTSTYSVHVRMANVRWAQVNEWRSPTRATTWPSRGQS